MSCNLSLVSSLALRGLGMLEVHWIHLCRHSFPKAGADGHGACVAGGGDTKARDSLSLLPASVKWKFLEAYKRAWLKRQLKTKRVSLHFNALSWLHFNACTSQARKLTQEVNTHKRPLSFVRFSHRKSKVIISRTKTSKVRHGGTRQTLRQKAERVSRVATQ